jgi:POT family proton-dependent oligopeptide transporter
LANILFRILCGASGLGLIWTALQHQGVERKHLFALIFMMLFSIGFWAIYAQMYSSVNLFTDRLVDRNLGEFLVPTPWFQSLQGFFIVLLTPLFVWVWGIVDEGNNWLKSGVAKFALAFFFLALAFLIWAHSMHGSGKVSAVWLAAGYLFLTAGELCLSPIGLSIFSEYAPKKYQGMMMGAWMLSISIGFTLADSLAKLSSIPQGVLHSSDIIQLEPYYHHAFITYLWCAVIGGLIVTAFTPLLNALFDSR